MNCENRVLTDSLLPVSDLSRCRSVQQFIMLMAHGRSAEATTHSARSRSRTNSSCESFPTDVARMFELQTGYTASAIALTAAVDDKLELARFLATDGYAAAVVLLDAEAVSRLWPPCDWKTSLLRVRNRLADEGSKFFVALTARREKNDITGAFACLSKRLLALGVERYCEREGIGFLGTIHTTASMTRPRSRWTIHKQLGTVIAQRLASRSFFCCDAFRTGAPPSTQRAS